MRTLLILMAVSCGLCSCSVSKPPEGGAELKTVAAVDLDRYAGRWFEIARYPQWFQKDCVSAVAEYSKLPDGTIRVVNTCIRVDDTRRSVTGVAEPVDGTGSRLKVRFTEEWFGKFIPVPDEGNYWVIHVSKDYRHAIVGTPDRKFLWFLSRSAAIPKRDFDLLKSIAVGQGFGMEALVVDAHTKINP